MKVCVLRTPDVDQLDEEAKARCPGRLLMHGGGKDGGVLANHNEGRSRGRSAWGGDLEMELDKEGFGLVAKFKAGGAPGGPEGAPEEVKSRRFFGGGGAGFFFPRAPN